MNEKDILKLVEETFDEEISSSEGQKEEFLKSLSVKLKVLFEDSDLSK